MFLDPADAGPARRLAVGAGLAEEALSLAMEQRLGEIGEVYHQGTAGTLDAAAKTLTAVGGALLATRGGKSRAAAVLGGLVKPSPH